MFCRYSRSEKTINQNLKSQGTFSHYNFRKLVPVETTLQGKIVEFCETSFQEINYSQVNFMYPKV